MLKSEVLSNYKETLHLSKENALRYEMNCQLSNPYMIINNDEEMIVSTLLNNVNSKYELAKISKMRK